jgi:hypothetical protein
MMSLYRSSPSCLVCGRAAGELGLLVAQDGSTFGACDVCLLDGLHALPREDRVEARRIVLQAAIARVEGSSGREREWLAQALQALPPHARAEQHLAHGSNRRRCFLCNGWSAGWSGLECDGGSFCGGCVARAMPMLWGDVVRLVAPYAASHGDDRPPNNETEPALRAFLALARTADDLRLVDDRASQLHHYRVGREALERIPAAERTPSDLFTLAHHHGILGDNETALAVHQRLSPDVPFGEHGRAVYFLNEASYLLEGGLATVEDLPRLEANLAEAREALARGNDRNKSTYLAMIQFQLALVRVRQNRFEDAARELEVARSHAAHNAHRWELEGVLRDLRGDHVGAREAWREGLMCAHPDDPVATRLERRLPR